MSNHVTRNSYLQFISLRPLLLQNIAKKFAAQIVTQVITLSIGVCISICAQPQMLHAETLRAYVFPIITPEVSSPYGIRRHPIWKRNMNHNGVDLAVPMGTPVRSIAQGVVVFAGPFGGFGKLVTILHRNNVISMYGHLSDIFVNTGEKITAGRLIGRVGSSGASTGPHLHFEVHKNNKPIDPVTLFPGIDEPGEG